MKRVSLIIVLLLALSLFSCNTTRYNVQYIRTDVFHEGADYPAVKIIRSTEQLDEYCEKNNFGTSGNEDFMSACEPYNEAYFEDQVLLLIVLEETSGSIRHRIQQVSMDGDDELIVKIKKMIPEVVTDDMAQWHLLIELESGMAPESEDDVSVSVAAK